MVDNTWMCGWKNQQGEVVDVEKVVASNAASAKYRYVKDTLFRKYPGLAKYNVLSVCKWVYAGTSLTSDNKPKPELSNDESFYKAMKPQKVGK